MYYHILAKHGKNTKKYCTYNLSKEKLLQSFITPYKKGSTILVGGENFNETDKPVIRIVKTTTRAETIIERLNDNAYKNNIVLEFYKPDLFDLSLAKDVTNEILGYVPFSKSEQSISNSRYVFVVHGHDDSMRNNVCQFLKNNGYNPVVLLNEPNGGATIIEKIEAWASEVCYGIVLYSPDDIGKELHDSEYNQRGRQNVIFEHGYLMAKLGRDKTCYLIKDDIEIPGDISGLIYIPYNRSFDWRTRILQELRNAGA